MGDSGVEPSAEVAPQAAAGPAPCTICLMPECNVESRVNGCEHSFCFVCISEWACSAQRASCPMCRKDIDNITYDFITHPKGRVQIGIREFRSIHLTLTASERNQLLGERRIVVRNLMHVFKLALDATDELNGMAEKQGEKEEAVKLWLTEFGALLKDHIGRAERVLGDLRVPDTRTNKAMVFTNPTFRRMIYSEKCFIKWLDHEKEHPELKLNVSDLAKQPERFRSIVTEFLISEFDVLPFSSQPRNSQRFNWRTEFFGSDMEIEEKLVYAARIYDLMLSEETGTEKFKVGLSEILPPISQAHIVILDNHLNAIVTVEKEDIHEFYNLVYYDSVYNKITNRTILDAVDFDQIMRNGGFVFEGGEHGRFDELFRTLARGPDLVHGDITWPDPFVAYDRRFFRQSSNTDRTDRATNNDDESVRSDSPEPRVPTPRPGPLDDMSEVEIRELLRRIDPEMPGPWSPTVVPHRERVLDQMRRSNHPFPGEVPHGQTSRTLPRLRTLRNNERRQREIQEQTRIERVQTTQPRPLTRRDIRSERARNFMFRSDEFARPRNTWDSFAPTGRFVVFGSNSADTHVHPISDTPVYTPSTPRVAPRRMPENIDDIDEEFIRDNIRHMEEVFQRIPTTAAFLANLHPGPAVLNGLRSSIEEQERAAAAVAFATAAIRNREPSPEDPEDAMDEEMETDDLNHSNTAQRASVIESTASARREVAQSGTGGVQEPIGPYDAAIAHRTRAARRAAAGIFPEAVPAKRAPNSSRE